MNWNPDRIATLIRLTTDKKKIWSVEVSSIGAIQNIHASNTDYLWEVDCDLDSFLIYQNEIESSDTNRTLSKRREGLWKTVESEEELIVHLNQSMDSIELKYNNHQYPYNDLIPIIAQDPDGGVLMQAWGNIDCILSAWNTKRGNYFSRSRNKFWMKGEESGHIQEIHSIEVGLSFPYPVIYHATQKGSACHTGEYSCYFRALKSWDDPNLIPK